MFGFLQPWIARVRREDGQALILFAGGLVAFLGLVGMSVDIGQLAYTRTDLQKAADAAALAGAQDLAGLVPSTEHARGAANNYVTKNGGAGTSATITFSKRNRFNDVIRVQATRRVNYGFLSFVGLSGANPSAQAAAYAGVAVSVRSLNGMAVLPWAINNDAFTGFGVRTGLQPANAQGGLGTYNLVSINPPNGQSYADAIANGVTAPIVAGASYRTNIADGTTFSPQTAGAINGRVNARASEAWNTFRGGSPRVVLIPVVNGGIPNAPNPVTITTFRAFFLEQADTRNSVIYGRFVEVNISGGDIAPPGATPILDLGVHVIKLIE